MGKWTHLRGVYPKLSPEAGQEERIAAVLDAPAPMWVLGLSETERDAEDVVQSKFTVRELSDFQLVKMYHEAKAEKDRLESIMSTYSMVVEALTRLLVDRMEDEGEQQKRFNDGTLVYIQDEPYPMISDQKAFLEWVNKDPDLAKKLTMNYMTMSSLVKEHLEAGVPLPPGVDVFMRVKLGRRGGGSNQKEKQ